MHGFALGVLGFALVGRAVELPSDVREIQVRRFQMPLNFDPDQKDHIKRVKLFVSEDLGKTWKHSKNYKTSDEFVIFEADRDGQFWFALQTQFKKGKHDPSDINGLTPAMKVYVNTTGKSLKVRKSYEELQREVEELQKTVEKLKKKLAESESDRGPEWVSAPVPAPANDPGPTIERLAKYIRHIHLEDIAATRVHHHLVPGEVAIEFRSALQAIQKIGDPGWITIELYPYLDDPDLAARTARERILQIAATL